MQRQQGATPLNLVFIGCLQTPDLDLSLVYLRVDDKWCRIKIEQSGQGSGFVKKTGREVIHFSNRQAMIDDAQALRRYKEGMAYVDLIEHTAFTMEELKAIVARVLRDMNAAA